MEITLKLKSLEQALVVKEALDFYARIGIGQFERLSELASEGKVPVGPQHSAVDENLRLEQLRASMAAAKSAMGYHANGSWGIGAPAVSEGAKRAYEINRVIAKALAEAREPDAKFRGVDYDGLIVRYTKDEAPDVTVSKKA